MRPGCSRFAHPVVTANRHGHHPGSATHCSAFSVAAGDHGHTEEDLRYVRRRYLSVEAARLVAAQIANATFAARQSWLWSEGSTAVAADSTHFSAFDQNIFTEWHSRYGGRGVLIYWHIDTGRSPSTPSCWSARRPSFRTRSDLLGEALLDRLDDLRPQLGAADDRVHRADVDRPLDAVHAVELGGHLGELL
ncbi:MAG: transposase, partial [Actinomycetia bacterium]|nr:transposase [Actinomycetes bacterium]